MARSRVLSAALDSKIDEHWIHGLLVKSIMQLLRLISNNGNFEDAKNFYNKAINFFEIAGDIESIIWTYYDIA